MTSATNAVGEPQVALRCIYCSAVLTSTTRPAHIWPDCLGGRLRSTTTVCNECNNSFCGLEGKVCKRLAPIGALAGARRGDLKAITATVEHEGSKWHAENGEMHELAGPPREKGRVHPTPARREDQVKTYAFALRSRGLPPEAMLDGRFILEPEPGILPVAEVQEHPVGQGFQWADRVTKRIMIKIAIELLARFDSVTAGAPELERARRFARYDEDDEHNFRAGFDSETRGAGLRSVDALWLHGIDVWTAGRKLHYRMTLFTEFKFVGTLTDSWIGHPLRISYTFDVCNPRNMIVDYEPIDGATLVSKNRRVRDREFADAIKQYKDKSFRGSAKRRVRAPKPDFNDLYPDVVAEMQKLEKRTRKD